MLSDLQKRKFTRAFRVLDGDGDGDLRREDFDAIGNNLAAGLGLAEGSEGRRNLVEAYRAEWEKLLKNADANGDGKIQLDEWLALQDRLVSDKAMFEEIVRSFSASLFQLFDRDRDERVTLDDLKVFWRAYRITDEEAHAAMWRKLDPSGAGYLTREQMRTVNAEFYLSDDPEAPGNYIWGPF